MSPLDPNHPTFRGRRGCMNNYLITYDLDKPGQNYGGLIGRLQEHGANRIELSVWILRTNWKAVKLRDDLRSFVDANDRLLVIGLTGEAAWTNLLISGDQVKKFLAA